MSKSDKPDFATVRGLFERANKAARDGYCRAAITWLGMGWRTYGAVYGEPTGPQRGARLREPLSRMQSQILNSCAVPEKRAPQKGLGRAQRRRK